MLGKLQSLICQRLEFVFSIFTCQPWNRGAIHLGQWQSRIQRPRQPSRSRPRPRQRPRLPRPRPRQRPRQFQRQLDTCLAVPPQDYAHLHRHQARVRGDGKPCRRYHQSFTNGKLMDTGNESVKKFKHRLLWWSCKMGKQVFADY